MSDNKKIENSSPEIRDEELDQVAGGKRPIIQAEQVRSNCCDNCGKEVPVDDNGCCLYCGRQL